MDDESRQQLDFVFGNQTSASSGERQRLNSLENELATFEN